MCIDRIEELLLTRKLKNSTVEFLRSLKKWLNNGRKLSAKQLDVLNEISKQNNLCPIEPERADVLKNTYAIDRKALEEQRMKKIAKIDQEREIRRQQMIESVNRNKQPEDESLKQLKLQKSAETFARLEQMFSQRFASNQ